MKRRQKSRKKKREGDEKTGEGNAEVHANNEG